jgi:hypothetical protein
VCDVGKPASGALQAFFGPRRLLARAAERLQCRPHGAIGLGERVFRLGEAVRGGAAFGFGLFDLIDQRPPLLGKHLWRIDQFGPLAFGLGDAGFKGGDLGERAVLAPAPGRAILGDGRQPAFGDVDLARERLRLGAHLGQSCAFVVDVAAHIGQRGLEPGGRGQGSQGLFGLANALDRLFAQCGEPGLRFTQG